jgi:hypothetical protein
LGQLAGNAERARGFEKKINGIYFYCHFYVKAGVKSPQEFFVYCLAPETKPTVKGTF